MSQCGAMGADIIHDYDLTRFYATQEIIMFIPRNIAR